LKQHEHKRSEIKRQRHKARERKKMGKVARHLRDGPNQD